ncbi:alpha/beta hydrolase [Gammaproteobacteria bacterium]|nr:alpha/beta hydrolase [Gammaproteobacteria bacterium]
MYLKFWTGILSVLLKLTSLAILLASSVFAQESREYKDIIYAKSDGQDLGLDIYMPAQIDSPPLLIFLHGGAWRFGDKSSGVPMAFIAEGFALASVDFRAATDAPFPAMLHDIKGAIRYLRTHASEYGYNAEKIAITGVSSGAHLAALVGVTNNNMQLEGVVGGNTSTSSAVQAIVSYFGASDLTTILAQSTPFGISVREPALGFLLGGLPQERRALAELASPVFHVDSNDPPLLLFHGVHDPQMPINQSHQLEGVYESLSLDVHFDPVHGAVHGGPEFFDEEHLPPAIEFLHRTIGY